MSEVLGKTPEERWRHLEEFGRHATVDLINDKRTNADRPRWFEDKKFDLARQVVGKFYIGINFSSFTGLLLVLQMPDGLEPLLATGNSKDIPSLYKRYLSTILHVKSWYDDDVFDPNTKGYKSIRQVRSMHRRVQHLMNERFETRDAEGRPRVWMSQHDFTMTQFAFVGFAMLFPEKCGMIAASKQELELISYYWRVLGWLMGLEDEFNCCQFDSYTNTKEMMALIFKRDYMNNFAKNPSPVGLEMSRAICLAMSYFLPLIAFNSLAHWWLESFNFTGQELQPLTKREKVLLLSTRIIFERLFQSERFLKFATKIHRIAFERRLKNRNKVYDALCKKYQRDERYKFVSSREDYSYRSDDFKEKGAVSETSGNDIIQESSLAEPPTFGGCPMGYAARLPFVA